MRVKRSSLVVLVLAGSLFAVGPTPASAAPLSECIGPGGSAATTNVKLTTDLDCTTSSGIVVGADGITIDLNGHTIAGDQTPGDNGIDNSGGFDDVTVIGGTVTKFFFGILGSNVANGMRVKQVLSSGNASDGIFISGDSVRVTSSRASGNGERGIVIGGGSARVSSSEASGNGESGVHIVGSLARVSSSRASGNVGDGVFILGSFAHVISSRASGNTVHGIEIEGDAAKIGRTSGRKPASDKNRSEGNGFVLGVSNGSGLGIFAQGFITEPVGSNVARGNDNPGQCDPTTLC
jgi:hypothetical protein